MTIKTTLTVGGHLKFTACLSTGESTVPHQKAVDTIKSEEHIVGVETGRGTAVTVNTMFTVGG